MVRIQHAPFLLVLVCSGVASAQQVDVRPVTCRICGGEAYHAPQCGEASQKEFYKAPVQHISPTPPQEGQPDVSQGQFIAPPPTGAVMGGANSLGMEGLAVHFPALTLQLPTVRLPSLFRTRRNPSMMIDAANAPFVQRSPGPSVSAMMVPVTPQQAPPPAAGQDEKEQGLPGKGPVQRDYGAALDYSSAELLCREQEMQRLQREVATLRESLAELQQTARAQQNSQASYVVVPVQPTWPSTHEAMTSTRDADLDFPKAPVMLPAIEGPVRRLPTTQFQP